MSRPRVAPAAAWALACASLFAMSCGGNDNPTGPSGGGSGGAIGATITLTSSGASPRSATVSAGQRVSFVNNDSRPHTMDSDPHPLHTDCPELSVGFVAAGASATSQNLTARRSCGFHDHDNPTNSAFQGTITIQ